MTKQLNVSEVIERARRAQESRLEVIQGLAEAQQNVANVRAAVAAEIADLERETNARIADAERQHVTEYRGAERAGWAPEELKNLGFTEPDKKARTRKRAPKKPAARAPQRASADTQSESLQTPAV